MYDPGPPSGVCIYRTNNIADPRSWLGFNGISYSVPLVSSYPTAYEQNYNCYPVLPAYYRFSWSYNVVLDKFIIIGLDTNYQQMTPQVEAIVYTLANLDPITGILSPATNTGPDSTDYKEFFLREITWIDVWQTSGNVIGQGYPSVLDPTSPEISNRSRFGLIPNDRNFQYSAHHPYLYYTKLYPQTINKGQNRDVVREALHVENCVP